MSWNRVWGLALGLMLGGASLALGQGADMAPAHPDLVKELGAKEVARMQRAFAPRRMASDMQIDFQAKTTRITGMGTSLVILWEFSDHTADQNSHPDYLYDMMMFSSNTFPLGSMNDYYKEVSHGAFGVTGLVSGWTTAINTYDSYANDDGSQDAYTCKVMIEDAIAQLDAVVDFSQFDNDGPDGIPNSGDDDGDVDSIFFVHAGPGQEQSGNENDIWSHAWSFWDGLSTDDGVQINRYSVEPEMLVDGNLMTMGVFAHEYGHVLGLPDLYDTDYSSGGIGEWGLMSGGSWTAKDGDPVGSSPSHMTAWCKMQLGWIDPVVITSDHLGVVIPPVETDAVAYRIFRSTEAGGSEYFLIENRRPIGFDEGLLRRQIHYGLARPEGLVIYHVDESQSNNRNDLRRLVDVVDASPWFNEDGSWHENLDGVRDYSVWEYVNAFNRGDNGDVWPGFSAFTADSTDWVGPRDRDFFSDESIPPAWDHECANTGVFIGNMVDDGLNVTVDFILTPQAPQPGDVVRGERSWDFESNTGDFKFCNSFAHFDQDHAVGCTGNGGLWFGSDQWDCPGYGNSWEDVAWVTVAVSTEGSPEVSLRHKFDLEPNYDFAYVEVRPAGATFYDWVEMAMFNGDISCTNGSYAIPQSVLSDADQGGVAVLDVRFRLSSDSGWSAEDGSYCGIGWWIDEVTISEMATTAVGELPLLGDVAHLDAPNPNPFNPATVLKYHVPTGARQVRLVVFDQRGRQIRSLSVDTSVGWHNTRWDGRSDSGGPVASGLYFARLTVDGLVTVQKMALIK